jgi:hypothetical protein
MAHTPERGNHPELDTGLLYHPGEHQTLLFNDSGTYIFRVQGAPGPTLRVNVADTDAK